MAKPAYLLVRAVLHDAVLRPRFDAWYDSYHLKLTIDRLGARSARRFWSHVERDTHYALYEFESMPLLKERMASDDLRFLAADFDSAWPTGVTRTRDFIELAQELSE